MAKLHNQQRLPRNGGAERSIENTRCFTHYRGCFAYHFKKNGLRIANKHDQIWKSDEHHQKVRQKYGRMAVNVSDFEEILVLGRNFGSLGFESKLYGNRVLL